MELKDIIILITIFILILLSSFFSAADMVYSTVDKLRLKKEIEQKNKKAKVALHLANNYDQTIPTIVFSNNLVNIFATSLASVSLLGKNLHPLIITLIMFALIVFFAEILPKVFGRVFSYRFSKLFAYPVLGLTYLVFPIVYVTRFFGTLITKCLKGEYEIDEEVISDDELHEMVETIEEEGLIDKEQGELLRSAITFIDTQAFEIMTPRINMFAYDIDDDINKLINDDKIFMYSRLPVYQESLDNIIGILPTKLLVKLMLENKPINVKELLLPVIYVPRFLNISNILKEFKLTHNHLAIVIDEYGGTEGLLTLEDIVEELVGEIFDEMDEIKEDIIQLDQTTFLVDGRVNIEDFFDLVFLEVDEEADYTTISGWCIDILEKFAKVGDAFTYKNLHVEIIEADEFRVEKVKVKVLEKEDKENN